MTMLELMSCLAPGTMVRATIATGQRRTMQKTASDWFCEMECGESKEADCEIIRMTALGADMVEVEAWR